MRNCARALVAIAFLLGLTGAVTAEGQDGVIVAMPFEFVVGAKSLPAGTYEVSNSLDDKSSTLVIKSRDQETSIFVLPYVRESVATDKPVMSFQQVGGQYFLSAIQTEATVYRIHVPDASVTENVGKANDGVSASGGHGGK